MKKLKRIKRKHYDFSKLEKYKNKDISIVIKEIALKGGKL